MFTRPADLEDWRVSQELQSAWSITVDSIEYAPVGFGSHHWLAGGADRSWFVTVDAIATGIEESGEIATHRRLTAALRTARLLHDLGLTFVVAPVATTEGDILVPIDDHYIAALYPYVDGNFSGWEPYADRASRVAVLDRLVSLHTAPAQARTNILVDGFEIPGRQKLATTLTNISDPWDCGPFAEPTRRLLAGQAGSIKERLARYDSLAGTVADRSKRFVVTHGEPHRGNTVATTDGVMLVDWDTVLLAPPERDLWWLTREDVTIIDNYETRTGTAVDAGALELYRLRWDLTDLSLFTAQLTNPHDDNQDTRTAWEFLAQYLSAKE